MKQFNFCGRLRVASLLLFLCCPVIASDEPPKPLTAQQREKLQQRNLHWQEAQKLESAGKLADAVAAAEKMLAIEREVRGPLHAEIAESQAYLATLAEKQEDFAAAHRRRVEVLDIRTRLHGKDDWRTTDARLALEQADLLGKLSGEQRRQLAETMRANAESDELQMAGKPADAIAIATKALETRKQLLGEAHRDVAASLSDLAALFKIQANFAQSELFNRQALEIRKKTLGASHPDVAVSLNNLGVLYLGHGDYAKAEPLLRQAVEVRKKALGGEEAAYVESLKNLAALFREKKEYSRSNELLEQALVATARRLGRDEYPKSPATAEIVNQLGILAYRQQDYFKAECAFSEAHQIWKHAPGGPFAGVRTALANLSAVYEQQINRLREKGSGDGLPQDRESLLSLQSLYLKMARVQDEQKDAAQAQKTRAIILTIRAKIRERKEADPGAPRPHLMVQSTAIPTCLALSPDSTILVTGSTFENDAIVWDAITGSCLRRLTGHSWFINKIVVPDRKRAVTASFDGEVRIWDLASGTEIQRFPAHPPKGEIGIAGSADGRRLLTGGIDRTVRLWDLDTATEILQMSGHTGNIRTVAISPDGKFGLSGGADRTVRLWDLATGAAVWTSDALGSEVNSLCFSPDGKHFAVAGWDRRLFLVDMKEKKWRPLLFSSYSTDNGFEKNKSSQIPLAFSPDGKRLLVGNWDAKVRSYDVETGSVVSELTPRALHSSARVAPKPEAVPTVAVGIFALAVSEDGKTMVSSRIGQVMCKWSIDENRLVQKYEGSVHIIIPAVAWSQDNRRLLVAPVNRADGSSVQLLDLLTGVARTVLVRVDDDPSSLSPVGLSQDAKLALLLGSGKDAKTPAMAHLIDLSTGRGLQKFPSLGSAFSPLGHPCLSPDGGVVYTIDAEGRVCQWDARTGKLRRSLGMKGKTAALLQLSPDGSKLAAGLIAGEKMDVCVWDTSSGEQILDLSGDGMIIGVAFSPDGRCLAVPGSAGLRMRDLQTRKELWFAKTESPCYRGLFLDGGQTVAAAFYDTGTQGHFRLFDAATGKPKTTGNVPANGYEYMWSRPSPDGRITFTPELLNGLVARNPLTGQEICRLWFLQKGAWAVVDADGRYDASSGGDVEGVHWVVGLEAIGLNQLKERYYEPGLFAKILGFNKEPLRKVAAFRAVKLFPDAVLTDLKPGDKKLTVDLTNRGGGIGRVQVFVNGKELLADARGPKPDVNAGKATLAVDLSGAHLIPGQKNKVEVVTWNAEGYLSSRGIERQIDGPDEVSDPPQLYAVVAGVSQYGNPALNLRFAAKDAEDFATALQLGGKRLFGTDMVHVTLLTTASDSPTRRPTKENLTKAFAELKKTKPGDVLVVYLAGHGVALQQGSDLYCYLTADARSSDPGTLNDPAVRGATTVSSEELAEWFKQIPALKQVMVLDTCAAGAAAMKLTEKRDVPGDQVRAMERLKSRTGFHVLMGCAADRSSYEATQFAQGLLTYSLLQGIRGAALREEQFVDVSKLFQYAADRVPELALHIGGVQRPLVAAPRGTSFDVGRLEAEDRGKVPLSLVKPLVLRPTLLNQEEAEDNLKLTVLLRARLAEASQPSERGKSPAIVYVPEDEFPGAVRPTGIYTVDGDKVSVRLTLKRDGAVVARPTVEGSKSDLPALVEKMALVVLKAAK